MITELDLSPAQWIWLPSQRCLPNTFVLFRHTFDLPFAPVSGDGWLLADSRYRLFVNGECVQQGPAPNDPRWPQADPVNLKPWLRPGRNVIGVEVCYFGHGDGTWPTGAPGLLFNASVRSVDGGVLVLHSGGEWLSFLDRAHPPGMYKRWFLRALQEQFDARIHPHGWSTPDFVPDGRWLPAMVISDAATTPPAFIKGPECGHDTVNPQDHAAMLGTRTEDPPYRVRARQIPLLDETQLHAGSLRETGRVRWHRNPDDWFENRTPGSLTAERDATVVRTSDETGVTVLPEPGEGVFLTYELPEHMAGWPVLKVDAPAGTIIEIMIQEGHDPVNGPAWLDTYFYHWSRLICREGANDFQAFDYECGKWIQVHIRNASGRVRVEWAGFRRRLYAFPFLPVIQSDEPGLQRLFEASVNTLRNSYQDALQDGGGRERQQYSGDAGHQLRLGRLFFGDDRLSERFVNTFSQGMTVDGYFLDTWPAYDRLVRLAQRQLNMTIWGPILDHGIQFVLDCHQHYQDSARLADLDEVYPRLLRYARYLEKSRGADGLLPVVDLGVPFVWLDHEAYLCQRHKQCAYNLYAAAALQHALAELAEARQDSASADWLRSFACGLLQNAIATFWCPERKLFVANRPWEKEEGRTRLCDRSLSIAVIFDQCPEDPSNVVKALAECPPELGISHPVGAIWRYQALAKAGRMDVVLGDFRSRWATMPSIGTNNTLAETWHVKPDARDEWSHCPQAPLILLAEGIIGLRPIAPGFKRSRIRPQLGDLESLDVTMHPAGKEIRFSARRTTGGHHIRVHADPALNLEIETGTGEVVPADGREVFIPDRLPVATQNH